MPHNRVIGKLLPEEQGRIERHLAVNFPGVLKVTHAFRGCVAQKALLLNFLHPQDYICNLIAMRYEPEHKARTHRRIVKNAARRFRAEGLSGPGVATVMKASGLTVGGFYKHFRSKDGLLAEAIEEGFLEHGDKFLAGLQGVAWR